MGTPLDYGYKNYNHYGAYLKNKYDGQRVYKIIADAGFTCPNRDGSKGYGGCTYCNVDSFTPELSRKLPTIREQIEQGMSLGVRGIEVADMGTFLREHPHSFDVIVARDILEHLSKEETVDLCGLVRGALKPRGSFIVQTVNAENLLWGRLRHADFTHDVAYTKESMRQLLLVEGFVTVDVYPQRPVAHGLFSVIRWIAWHLFEWALRFYLLVETGSTSGIFTQNIIAVAKL